MVNWETLQSGGDILTLKVKKLLDLQIHHAFVVRAISFLWLLALAGGTDSKAGRNTSQNSLK